MNSSDRDDTATEAVDLEALAELGEGEGKTRSPGGPIGGFLWVACALLVPVPALHRLPSHQLHHRPQHPPDLRGAAGLHVLSGHTADRDAGARSRADAPIVSGTAQERPGQGPLVRLRHRGPGRLRHRLPGLGLRGDHPAFRSTRWRGTSTSARPSSFCCWSRRGGPWGWRCRRWARSSCSIASSARTCPGFSPTPGIPLDFVVDHMYLSDSGIWGVPLGVSTDFVFLFVLFGALLDRAGGGGILRAGGFRHGGPFPRRTGQGRRVGVGPDRHGVGIVHRQRGHHGNFHHPAYEAGGTAGVQGRRGGSRRQHERATPAAGHGGGGLHHGGVSWAALHRHRHRGGDSRGAVVHRPALRRPPGSPQA